MKQMNEIKSMEKEKIPLLVVYKQDGVIKTDCGPDALDYELWGFLKLFVEQFGEQLKDCITPRMEE